MGASANPTPSYRARPVPAGCVCVNVCRRGNPAPWWRGPRGRGACLQVRRARGRRRPQGGAPDCRGAPAPAAARASAVGVGSRRPRRARHRGVGGAPGRRAQSRKGALRPAAMQSPTPSPLLRAPLRLGLERSRDGYPQVYPRRTPRQRNARAAGLRLLSVCLRATAPREKPWRGARRAAGAGGGARWGAPRRPAPGARPRRPARPALLGSRTVPAAKSIS